MLVILHGWSDNYGSFKRLAGKLVDAGIARDGVEEIRLGDYVSLDDEVTFDDLVAALDRAWSGENGKNRPLPRTPRAVDVVVHSTGALVIRAWLTRHFAAETAPVHRLLMLAPANFGSPLAHTGRSIVGRATKGWRGARLFETGTHILKGLELASPFSTGLAALDRFGDAAWYGPGRMLGTVLVGNTGYSGISSIANRPGTDGTVRVSTANLNCTRLDLDFATDPHKPALALQPATGRTAFGVMDGEDHSTIACKDRGPRKDITFDSIVRALQVDDEDFAEWCDTLDVLTRSVMEKRNANRRRPHFHGYQNTVILARDQYGNHIPDYAIEIYLNDDSGRRERRATQRVQEEMIENVQCYGDDPAYRSMLIDCRALRGVVDRDDDRLNISITASPDIGNRDVGFRTYTDDDIGSLSLSPNQVDSLFSENRTLLVTITLRREQSDRLFRLKPY